MRVGKYIDEHLSYHREDQPWSYLWESQREQVITCHNDDVGVIEEFLPSRSVEHVACKSVAAMYLSNSERCMFLKKGTLLLDQRNLQGIISSYQSLITLVKADYENAP